MEKKYLRIPSILLAVGSIILVFLLIYFWAVDYQRVAAVKEIAEISLDEIEKVGIYRCGSDEIAHYFDSDEKEEIVGILNNAEISMKPIKEDKKDPIVGGPELRYCIVKTNGKIINFSVATPWMWIEGRIYECDDQSGSKLYGYTTIYRDKIFDG